MTSECILKRKREEAEGDETPSSRRSAESILRSDIWYDDGNLILQAGRTQFRVHRGVLAKHSGFFREVSLPENTCSILELSDSAEDIGYLLETFYEWTFRSCQRLPLKTVTTLISLSYKYRIPRLTKELVTRLQEDWPADYEVWVSRSRPDIRSVEGDDNRTIVLQMLYLARTYNLASLLPALYLDVYSLFSLEELDSNVADIGGQELNIPLEERMRLMSGLVRLRYAISTTGWAPVNRIPLPGCRRTQNRDCLKAKIEMYEKEFENTHSLRGSRPSLLPVDAKFNEKLCGACAVSIQEHKLTKMALWAVLPAYFKLPAWEELLVGEV